MRFIHYNISNDSAATTKSGSPIITNILKDFRIKLFRRINMETYQALVLGMVQGLTEFLPISSSGHLALGQHSFGITTPTLFFDISLHIGTLAAVVVVFFDNIKAMVTAIIRMVHTLIKFNLEDFKRSLKNDPDIRLASLIIVGSIPTALLGLFLKHYIDSLFDSINFVGSMLILTGTFLWLTKGLDRSAGSAVQKARSDGAISGSGMEPGSDIMRFGYKAALFIGLCQGIAVVPGISRSGATIVAGLFAGIERETAAKFSFLLSIPAIVGAELLGLSELNRISFDSATLWGTVIAFVVGYGALKVLMKIVKHGNLYLFAPYCWILGVIAVIAGVL